MTNPNETTVFSPEGESFEMSRANARDLVEHAGWSFTQPRVVERIVEVKVADTGHEPDEDAVAEAEALAEAEAAARDAEDETRGTREEVEAAAAGAPVAFTDAAQFNDLQTRDELVDYLAEHFPDFKPHHKAGRDSLVEKAVELANA